MPGTLIPILGERAVGYGLADIAHCSPRHTVHFTSRQESVGLNAFVVVYDGAWQMLLATSKWIGRAVFQLSR
jgi:hypothetical protein